jgi:hypothetical protein
MRPCGAGIAPSPIRAPIQKGGEIMRVPSGCRPLAVAAFAALALCACAPSNVETTQAYEGSKLPRPDVVVVNDYTVASDGVLLDRGLGSRAERILSGGSSAEEQRRLGRSVANAVSDTMVAELRAAGLPAVRANDPTGTTGTNRLIVGGELLSVDQGNRTRRNLIGLGAGQSRVASDTTVTYSITSGGERNLLAFRADAESSRRPGAAETMGVGAATGRLATAGAATAGTSIAGGAISDDLNPAVEADARRMARGVAEKIEDFARREGWIPTRPAR